MARLKVAKRSRDAATVEILDGFIVTTPFLTKVEQEGINRRSKPAAQQDNPLAREDPDLAAKAYADAYVLDWTGLTPDIIRALGIVLEEDPPTDDKGFIAYDQELSRDLWRHAFSGLYAYKITEASNEIQRQQYEQKKTQRSSVAG